MEAYIEPVNEYVLNAWTRALNAVDIKVHTDPQSLNREDLCFVYCDYDNYDFEKRDRLAQWVYSYIYRKALTRKNYLDNTILHYRAKRPKSILHSAWPNSYNLEVDFPEFLDDALDESWDLKQELAHENKIWILKPALGERAHGIHIFRTQNDLQEHFDRILSSGSDEEDDIGDVAADMRQYVVQEYISNPLLIDNRKFHFRVYCVCVGKLRLYVNTQVLMLFSGSKYHPNSLVDLKGHLTNTCYQGDQAKVSLLEDELPNDVANSVVNDICECVADLFTAALGDPINFQALPNAIEFYGIDFLLTEDYQIKLLEVNAYPDFKQTGAKLRHVVDNLFVETARILFSPNKNVVHLRQVLCID